MKMEQRDLKMLSFKIKVIQPQPSYASSHQKLAEERNVFSPDIFGETLDTLTLAPGVSFPLL